MPFPDDLTAPDRLRSDGYLLRPITAADAELDHAAVMASRDALRLWEQSTWPEDDFTVEDNLADMIKMEQRHQAGQAYGYTVLTPDESTCLGCVYVFPNDARFLAASTVDDVSELRWDDVEAAVYFWVRSSHVDDGLDRDLLDGLRSWFASDWGLRRVVYVTSEPFEQQVAMIEATDLERCFTLTEPEKPGRFLVFGSPG